LSKLWAKPGTWPNMYPAGISSVVGLIFSIIEELYIAVVLLIKTVIIVVIDINKSECFFI